MGAAAQQQHVQKALWTAHTPCDVPLFVWQSKIQNLDSHLKYYIPYFLMNDYLNTGLNLSRIS